MKFRKLKSPINVQWEITPKCNYKCIHCYNYWRNGQDVLQNIDYGLVTKELIENHIFKVTLTGGEPLLMFEQIKPYIEEMVKAGIKVSINTNASLLTKEMAKFFKDNDISLLISLPCYNPKINDQITTVEGSFKKTVTGIKLARRFGVHLSINMVVSKLNKDYIKETAQFLHDDLGINAINVTKASRPINCSCEFDNYALTLEEFRQMQEAVVAVQKDYSMFANTLEVSPECSCKTQETFNLFATRKCFAGKTTLAIGYNGDVKACERDIVSYGNLKTRSLRECWDNMDDWRAITDFNLPKECLKCEAKSYCSGGCRIDRNNPIPGKSYIDPNNTPIKFKTTPEKTFEFSSDEIFEVSSGLQFFKEDFGMRGINSNKDVFFITDALYSFILANSSFSITDFLKFFEISESQANQTLSYLIKNKAINTF